MPVSYLWSNGQTTPTATNLSSGNYIISITDANGCSATDTAIVTGTSNTSVVASLDQLICNGGVPNPLSAVGNSTGTYTWSPSNYFTDPNVQNPVFSTGINSTSTFEVTFTDAAGCTSKDSVTLINSIAAQSTITDDDKATLKRNVDHIEIIKAYIKEDGTTSIWGSEDFFCVLWMWDTICEPIINYSTYFHGSLDPTASLIFRNPCFSICMVNPSKISGTKFGPSKIQPVYT